MIQETANYILKYTFILTGHYTINLSPPPQSCFTVTHILVSQIIFYYTFNMYAI